MLFQHSLAFLGKLCIYQEGKRGGRERGGARHSAVFAAGSKMPLCLVCRQLWFSYIFMGIPLPLLPFESPGAYIDSQDTGLGGGLQGIEGFQGWRRIHLLLLLQLNIRSQGQAPASFASPDPSQPSFLGKHRLSR